jgi:hypothetical protein
MLNISVARMLQAKGKHVKDTFYYFGMKNA